MADNKPEKKFDRGTADIGNIVNLGHINVNISDQRPGTHYYVSGLGLTRDPYLNTGVRIMWVNVGMSQFHLPTGEPNLLRGTTGLVIPDRAALFGRIALGMAYIVFDVRPGTAHRIARFYREVMGARTEMMENGVGQWSGPQARVEVGDKQYFYFRETDAPEIPYDRHHAQIYIANFSGPYRKLVELGLITVEFSEHEYRFQDIVDLDTREVLFTVEHEVRAQTHPMFGRPLVNRNPAQSNRDYKPGHDEMAWGLA